MFCPNPAWMSCPLSCRGCPVHCHAGGVLSNVPHVVVLSNVQQGRSCPMSNRAVVSIVQQGRSCPMSNTGVSDVQQGCHVHCPIGVVMSNRSSHVHCPTEAVMSIVQQELSCPMSNRDVMSTGAVMSIVH